jgi:hypothetical protein
MASTSRRLSASASTPASESGGRSDISDIEPIPRRTLPFISGPCRVRPPTTASCGTGRLTGHCPPESFGRAAPRAPPTQIPHSIDTGTHLDFVPALQFVEARLGCLAAHLPAGCSPRTRAWCVSWASKRQTCQGPTQARQLPHRYRSTLSARHEASSSPHSRFTLRPSPRKAQSLQGRPGASQTHLETRLNVDVKGIVWIGRQRQILRQQSNGCRPRGSWLSTPPRERPSLCGGRLKGLSRLNDMPHVLGHTPSAEHPSASAGGACAPDLSRRTCRRPTAIHPTLDHELAPIAPLPTSSETTT